MAISRRLSIRAAAPKQALLPASHSRWGLDGILSKVKNVKVKKPHLTGFKFKGLGNINFKLPEFHSPKSLRLPTKQEFIKFLFSEVGLVLLIIGYIVGGGYLFRWIEYPNEWEGKNLTRTLAAQLEVSRQDLKDAILNLTNSSSSSSDGSWGTWANTTRTEIRRLIEAYHDELATAIDSGYDGTIHQETEEKYGWGVTSSILYTASILTTIGYGHICPVTELGQAVTLGYAVLAIPLMSMFLMRVGNAMVAFISWVYVRAVCRLCARKRLKSHGYEHMSQYKDIERKVDKHGNETSDGSSSGGNLPALCVILVTVLYVLLGTTVFYYWIDDWNFIESLYCCMVTITTIGFGDYVPGKDQSNTTTGKLLLAFTAVYVVAGLAVLAIAIAVSIESVIKLMASHRSTDDYYKYYPSTQDPLAPPVPIKPAPVKMVDEEPAKKKKESKPKSAVSRRSRAKSAASSLLNSAKNKLPGRKRPTSVNPTPSGTPDSNSEPTKPLKSALKKPKSRSGSAQPPPRSPSRTSASPKPPKSPRKSAKRSARRPKPMKSFPDNASPRSTPGADKLYGDKGDRLSFKVPPSVASLP